MSVWNHIKRNIFRGLLAVTPLVLSFLVIRFLYQVIDKKVLEILEQFLGFTIPGMGLLCLVIIMYALGLIAGNVIGKQMFQLLERVSVRIPLIGATYRVGKQLSESLAIPEKHVFQKTVLLQWPQPGTWAVGFVTGVVSDQKNPTEKWLRVFVPTTPNPTSGYVIFVKDRETRDPGWTVEEALKMVLSGGIIGPPSFN